MASVSDYRGTSQIINRNVIMNNTALNNSATMSYAKVAQQTVFPRKEQAIVLDAAEGTSIHDHTSPLVKLSIQGILDSYLEYLLVEYAST